MFIWLLNKVLNLYYLYEKIRKQCLVTFYYISSIKEKLNLLSKQPKICSLELKQQLIVFILLRIEKNICLVKDPWWDKVKSKN